MGTIKILVGTNHISGTAEAVVVKFCTRVGYVKSQQTDDKWPSRKRGVVVTHFKFRVSNDISGKV